MLIFPKTFGAGIDHPLAKRADESLEDAAVSFVHSRLGLDATSVTYKSGYSGEVAKHAFVKQTFVSASVMFYWNEPSTWSSQNGIPVANAVANVAFNHDNKVVSFGSSFVKPSESNECTCGITDLTLNLISSHRRCQTVHHPRCCYQEG